MEVMKGDNKAKHSFCSERVKTIDDMAETAKDIIAEEQCFKVTDLAVSGNDMLALGLKGAEIGQTLRALLEAVISEEADNDRESLIKYASKYIKENFS